MKKFRDKKSFKEIEDDLLKQSFIFEEKNERTLFNVIELDIFKKFRISLDQDCNKKIADTILKARRIKDSDLFKKLFNDIWEFRINYKGSQYRLLAFWNKNNSPPTVVITHGFIKKTYKIPSKELNRAIGIRSNYLNNN